MACGEGYGSDVLARSAASVVGVDANPEAHEHARLRYRAREPPLRARPGRDVRRAGRRGRVPADDRAPRGPGRGARALPLAVRRSRGRAVDRVRLDAERADAGAQGRLALGQSLARARVPRRGVRAALPRALREVEMYGLFHARKLRAHELALRLGWDRVHPRLGLTARFYDCFTPAIAASDFALRPAGRPTSTARWTSSPCAGREQRAPRSRRAGDRPAHAHALRRGLRHLALRRGVAVGGDRGQLPAAARAARRRRAADAVADAGALRPARGGRRRASASRAFVEEVRRETHAEDAAGCARGGDERARARARTLLGRLRARAARALARSRRRPARGARAARAVDLLGDARGPAAAATDAGVRAAAAQRHRARTARASATAGAAGFWLPECALRAVARARCSSDAGVERDVRRADRAASGSARASTCARSRPTPGCVLVPIDRATMSLVWSDDGYPAGGAYRDYHHHTIHHHNPWNNDGRGLRPRARRWHSRASTPPTSSRARVERLQRRRRLAGGGLVVVRARHRAARPLVVRGGRAGCAR